MSIHNSNIAEDVKVLMLKGEKGDPAPPTDEQVQTFVDEWLAEHPESMIDDELITDTVDDWLDEHPEATTTVQDGSLTETKFSSALKLKTIKDYVTPEMFGAVGDGMTDDTNAVKQALNSGKPVICTKQYGVSETLHVENSIEMIDDSIFIALEALACGVVIAGKGTQQVFRTYKIAYDSNSLATIGIACANVKSSILILSVKNSKDIGIVGDYMKYTDVPSGNNQNEFTCFVDGKNDGTSIIGVLVNNYDSVYRGITTKDVQYGAKFEHTAVIVDVIHSWLTQTGITNYWENSAVVYLTNTGDARINWLYQDTVRYGIYAESGMMKINHFFEKSGDYNGELAPINAKLTDNTIYSCITVDSFKTDRGANAYMTWEGFANTIKYGCYDDLTYAYSKNPLDNTFDANDAPTIGSFNCKWNVQNLPKTVNGTLECMCVGTLFIQKYYWQSGTYITMYVRAKTISVGSWSDWKEFSTVNPS